MTIKSILAGAAVALGLSTAAFAADVKVGFVYVGPTGDHGWTYRHDIGRQQVEEAFGDRVVDAHDDLVEVSRGSGDVRWRVPEASLRRLRPRRREEPAPAPGDSWLSDLLCGCATLGVAEPSAEA